MVRKTRESADTYSPGTFRALRRVHQEYAEAWPDVRVARLDQSAAVYGSGREAVEVVLHWAGISECAFQLRVTPDRRLVALRIEVIDAKGDLPSARQLQKIPYGRLRDAAADIVRRIQEATDPYAGPEDLINSNVVRQQTWATVFEDRPRPGRAGRDDRFYAELAASYVDACAAAPRRGLVELKQRLEMQGGQYFSAKQLGSLVYEARRRGLLTYPKRKGVQGGDLTPKARDLLRGDSSGSH